MIMEIEKMELNVLQLISLLKGVEFAPKFKSEADKRATWEKYRDFLISKDYDALNDRLIKREPGTRPWAWWKYEAPEPRRIIENAEYWRPLDKNDLMEYGEYYGTYNVIPSGKEFPEDNKDFPIHEFESEFAYLKRLNLLLPGEEEKVKKCKQEGGDRALNVEYNI